MTRHCSDVSLVITVLNEAASLPAWFASFDGASALPSEIVICDGGSTDQTLEVIDRFAAGMHVPVRVISSPGANISRGRNAAITAARGEWIAVTDAGTTLSAKWLAELLHSRDGADVVGGFFSATGTKPFQRALATLITPLREEIVSEDFLPSSRSLLVRRSAWKAVGGYPEWLDYCEDLIFDLELKRAGYRFRFAPDALVTWSAREDLPGYVKQYYRYARGDGKALLWPKRHLARYGAFGLGAGLAVLTCVTPWAGALLGVGYLIYARRYYYRALRSRNLRTADRLVAVLLVPVVAVTGDIAKLAGYPVGRFWRWRTAKSERGFQ